MNSSRTFIAIELDGTTLAILDRVIHRMKNMVEGVRWSRSDQLHLTLKFLGDIDDRELPELCSRMRAACADVPPFGVGLRGIGTFPKNKPPRIVWAAVDEGLETLRLLKARLEEQLLNLGIPGELRMFTPHLTLGRVARGANLEQLEQTIQAASSLIAHRWEVNQVLLFASRKEQGKHVYEPIDIAEL